MLQDQYIAVLKFILLTYFHMIPGILPVYYLNSTYLFNVVIELLFFRASVTPLFPSRITFQLVTLYAR